MSAIDIKKTDINKKIKERQEISKLDTEKKKYFSKIRNMIKKGKSDAKN